jgi:signal transduction histidine kinase
MDIPQETIQTRYKGERFLHTKKIPVLDEMGNPRYLLGISEDITDRKRAEERISLANRKLALMTDVTYQDIQNKVTGLRGYVELSKNPQSEQDRLSFIDKEMDLLETIHNLIKKTKDYQQMGVDQSCWVPLEKTIQLQWSSISQRKNVSLESDMHGLEIYADPLVDQVFYNLMRNAIQHGKTLTHISFRCRETPDGVLLICEDDGIGIPFKQKSHIFDRVVGGAGTFGLFFVREFLDIAGMKIAETGTPGKGARFEIQVPKGAYRLSGDTG